jgi:membrane fusion protein (multidrug efflux system)
MSATETEIESPILKPAVDVAASPPPLAAALPKPAHAKRSWVRWAIVGIVAVLALAFGVPWLIEVLRTVSTDDAYVNGHVTFVAPRVAGQVSRVLVDDNNRVRRGDVLVQLDKEPYQVQVNIAQAAVDAAKADLVNAQAQARATAGEIRAQRFNLDTSIQDVDNQIALLGSKVAALNSEKATLVKAQADYERAVPLLQSGGVTQEEVDHRKQAMLVAEAQVEQALEDVYQVRVSLGLPPKPTTGDDLTNVPPDLDQTFSAVRQAQMKLMGAAAQLGVADSFNKSPKQMVADFYKRDPSGDIDRILEKLLAEAPGVKQAQSKLGAAQRNLDQALLNLRYTDVVAEIDGVVTRRAVNPGNNVVAGQSLMALRSLTEIWIDANFKETQLGQLRIGQPVDLDVDMYGSREQFKGRISGFTFGTGSTLALLPAENATGNFVKVVQRLPVRIDVLDYDPDKQPLFIGLSVTPHVRIKEEPSGPNAGQYLQPEVQVPMLSPLPTTAPVSPQTQP